jgi:hypothetical protein
MLLLLAACASTAVAGLPPLPGHDPPRPPSTPGNTPPAPGGGSDSKNATSGAPAVITNWGHQKDECLIATSKGLHSWQQTAALKDVRFFVSIAYEGHIVGPALEPLIVRNGCADCDPRVVQAFGAAMGDAWGQWCESVHVPALPLFPVNFSLNSHIAANPVPLIALQMDTSPLEPDQLSESIRRHLGDLAASEDANAAIIDFTRTISIQLHGWISEVMVAGLIGSGPVPPGFEAPIHTAATPGLLLGGSANQVPGLLAFPDLVTP